MSGWLNEKMASISMRTDRPGGSCLDVLVIAQVDQLVNQRPAAPPRSSGVTAISDAPNPASRAAINPVQFFPSFIIRILCSSWKTGYPGW